MKKYLDKTFWKMFFGFLAIISVAFVVIFGVKAYQSNQVSRGQNTITNISQ